MTTWRYESPKGQAVIFEDDQAGDVRISPQALVELAGEAPEGWNPVRIPVDYLLDYLEGLGFTEYTEAHL